MDKLSVDNIVGKFFYFHNESVTDKDWWKPAAAKLIRVGGQQVHFFDGSTDFVIHNRRTFAKPLLRASRYGHQNRRVPLRRNANGDFLERASYMGCQVFHIKREFIKKVWVSFN
jgi:hypothetical protein